MKTRHALNTTIRPYTPHPARAEKERSSFSFNVQKANDALERGETAHAQLNVDTLFEQEDIVILGGSNDAIAKFLCPNIPSLANQRHQIAVLVESIPHDLDVDNDQHLLPPVLRYAIDQGVSLFGIGERQGPTMSMRAKRLIDKSATAVENDECQRIIEDLANLTRSVHLSLQGHSMDQETATCLENAIHLTDQLTHGHVERNFAMNAVRDCAHQLKGPILEITSMEQKKYFNVRVAAPIRNANYHKVLALVGTASAAVVESDKPSIAELVHRTSDRKVDVALLTQEKKFEFKCYEHPDRHFTTTERYLHVPVQDSAEHQAARAYEHKVLR